MLKGLRGEDSIAALCRRDGIAESLNYAWLKELLEAGKRRLAASAAVLTSGTMIPYAPGAWAFKMVARSRYATRTAGTVSFCEVACSKGATSCISEAPYCRWTHRTSKPWRTIASAVNP